MSVLTTEEKLQIEQLMNNLPKAKLTWIASVTRIDLDYLCENVDETNFYIEKDYLVNPKFDKDHVGELQESGEITTKISKNQRALKDRLNQLSRIITIRSMASFVLGIISLTNFIVLIISYFFGYEYVTEAIADVYFVTITHGIIFGALAFNERKRAKTGLIMNIIALTPVIVIRILLIIFYINQI